MGRHEQSALSKLSNYSRQAFYGIQGGGNMITLPLVLITIANFRCLEKGNNIQNLCMLGGMHQSKDFEYVEESRTIEQAET